MSDSHFLAKSIKLKLQDVRLYVGWVDPVIISKTELLLRSRFLQKCIAQIIKTISYDFMQLDTRKSKLELASC